jgi:hypothetical protein
MQSTINSLSLLDVIESHNDEAQPDESPSLFKNSPYYSDDSLIDVLSEKIGVFTLLSVNIQSLQAKFDQLKIYLQMLISSNCEFTAICLQETWLRDTYDTSLLALNGYSMITRSSSCSVHGGICI